MDRRNFFKIVSATGAGALTVGCGSSKTDALIPLLVPEDQLVPGEEQWHPAVCNECSAGCGTIVRVMEGRRAIETKDGPARERRAAIKKIEGNPLDPISGGRLCARGQAVVQALYHPDRLRGPRASLVYGTQATTVVPLPVLENTWDNAIGWASEEIKKAGPDGVVFLTGSQVGTRSLAIERFMAALKAPAPIVCALDDFAAERTAAHQVFGWNTLPVYDLAKATHVLSVGADFLGSWTSPVYYARQYGQFRRGRQAVRGHLIHAESRMSLTASSADQWLPIKPGTEAALLSALYAIIARKRGPTRTTPGEPALFIAATGLPAAMIEETARILIEAPVPLVIGGASIVQANSVYAITMAHKLNQLLNATALVRPTPAPLRSTASALTTDTIAKAKVLLIDGTDPAYTLPGFQEFAKNAVIVSFSPFQNDTAAMARLILPDHHYLESETALIPSVSPIEAVTVGAPFVRPLYETRAVEQTLADIAAKLGIEYERVTAETVAQPFVTAELPYSEIARAGGAQKETGPQTQAAARTRAPKAAPAKPAASSTPAAETVSPAAKFSGDPEQFPFHFQAYLSLQFHDGRSAHLPWMQELPDPASSAMWGLPVEIDPQTAARLGIANGDRVKVESQFASLEAPAYVNPAAIPDVLSMAIGGGHSNYTRYASHGANPLSILDPAHIAPVLTGGTRVRLSRVGNGQLTQYSAKGTEQRKEAYR